MRIETNRLIIRDFNENVRDKVQKILGCPVVEVRKFEKGTNNSVYSVVTAKQRYIFKQYRDKNWPEDCKVPFVHQLLEQNHIPKASLIQYCKQDVEFPNGFLLETEVRGVCADKTSLSKDQEKEFYAKFATLVSKVHNIQFQKFGYIGAGCPQYDSMESFFQDNIDDTVNALVAMNLYTKGEMEVMKTSILQIIKEFEDLPPVLCHGDLSTKNVMIQENGDLILIDWDDTIAYNWMADIARMTFWMRMNYQKRDYKVLRNIFLDRYQTKYRKSEFSRFERIYHLYNALDNLRFFVDTGNQNMQTWIRHYINLLQ